ncbi:MAG: molybdopterin oxidoreductase [Candidatus Muproteobacteria bacterium RBG_16_65_31]|uniref:Molybdopterin oxidoreductase n=1 Tax=Candidatus Muproteobacteria bacterium RBG_16_65_31 TaxID=1817759 RepID=A0A1F6TEN3_9PROT|nr:MAG: molybdopterin oxidoreductase [Candidatus Muproteobacteria bacterium RBG_16_65_31]
MTHIHYREIEGRSLGYYVLLALLGALVLAGLAAAWYMEHNGHWVTGMSNQIVWGTPHVFAVFLIVAASGALNAASIASVFGRAMYKPLARLSGLLAVALLAGGLAVLVLDLGRPDRLIVAMTYYNFKSIFAWNIFLYTGFLALVAVYLWMMFERRMNDYAGPIGLAAFIWRLVLTTGTGSIFGFLVARQAYDTAVLAPLFIAMSLSFGTAIFILVLLAAGRGAGVALGDEILRRLKNLQGIFVASVLYFVAVYHLTNLYIAEHHGVERFLLLEGGVYTTTFWIGQIVIGGVLPLLIFFHPALGRSRALIALGCALVLLGGLAQIYVFIIGGQAYPLLMFPDKEVSSSFFDGAIADYAPSLPEVALGVGGVAIALTIVALALKVLPFLPASLADGDKAVSGEQ